MTSAGLAEGLPPERRTELDRSSSWELINELCPPNLLTRLGQGRYNTRNALREVAALLYSGRVTYSAD